MFQSGIAAQLLAIASLFGLTVAISRRDATPYVPVPISNVIGVPAEMGLRTSESWYWGPGEAAPIANLTGYFTGQYQKVIDLDRFSSLLQSTQCSSTHDSITLVFKDQSSYGSAKGAWDWVNQMTFRSFILTLQIPGCQVGVNVAGQGRQPYQVNGVRWSDSTNTAVLIAAPKTWDEVVDGNSWEMFVDSRGLAGSDGLQKRITIDQSPSINLSHDFSQPIFSDTVDGITVSLDCSECHTDGSLDFQLHIIPFLIPPHIEGFAQVTPDNLGATAVVSLNVAGSITDGINKDVNLATVSLPGGFSIAGVANFGPTLQIGITTQLSAIDASASASFGVQMSIPEGSIAKVDFSNSQNNELSGWTPTFNPVPPQFQSEFSVSGSIGPQLTIALEATVLGQGLAAGLALLAPKLEANLQGQVSSTGGVCNDPNADAGLSFGLDIGAEVDAFAGVGKAVDLPGKVAILTTDVNLFTTCIALSAAPVASTPVPPAVILTTFFEPATPTPAPAPPNEILTTFFEPATPTPAPAPQNGFITTFFEPAAPTP